MIPQSTQEDDPTDPLQDEEQEEEPEEVTRCICGNSEPLVEENDEDTGLFVQCDKCLVWQHGYCVGLLSDAQMPETYYCEQCRPDLHQIIQRPRKPKVSKFLGVDGTSSPIIPHEEAEEESTSRKRRSTMNSRDAAYDRQLEAALLLSAQQDRATRPPSISGRSARSARKPSPAPSKRTRNTSPSPDPEESKKKRKKTTLKKEETTPTEPSTTTTKKKKGKKKVLQQHVETPTEKEEDSPSLTSTNHISAPPSRTSTPPPRKRGTRQTRKNTPTQSHQITSLPVHATPGKMYPWIEMRRRVGAIMEFIGRAQVELSSERDEWVSLGGRMGDSAALKMMEEITINLLKWEAQYG